MNEDNKKMLKTLGLLNKINKITGAIVQYSEHYESKLKDDKDIPKEIMDEFNLSTFEYTLKIGKANNELAKYWKGLGND